MNFLNHKLPPHNNGTINVTVRYIGEIENVSVDSTISSQSVGSLLDALQKRQPGFSVRKFLGYFKLTKEKELLAGDRVRGTSSEGCLSGEEKRDLGRFVGNI